MPRKTFPVSVLITAFVLLAGAVFVKQPCFAGQALEELKYNKLFANSYDCEFVDPNNGWLGGKAGILYGTEDGGITWKMQDTGMDESIFGISFIDKDTGWAVGQAGAIISTTDGGKIWIQQKSPVEDHLLCVKFTDPHHGVAAGDWGKIILTEDGGKNWVDVSLKQDIILYGVDFVSKNEGFIAAETGIFFHTVDGGKSWEKQETDVGNIHFGDIEHLTEEDLEGVAEGISFFALSFDGKGNGVAVGLDGRASRTADNGNTWKTQTITKEALYNVVLIDGKGLAVGDAAGVYETRDSGKSWHQIEVPEMMRQFWFQCVARLDENEYVVAGSHGAMLFVKDSKVVKTSLD